jgi:hypothetical protein
MRLLGCDTKSHEYLSRSSIEDWVFCHQYPTETCAGSNSGVRSSRDNGAHSSAHSLSDTSLTPFKKCLLNRRFFAACATALEAEGYPHAAVPLRSALPCVAVDKYY